MSKNILLSSMELIYISALLDATEFFGIPDAFYGMTEFAVNQEVQALQQSLTQKGYAKTDFNGFVLNSEIITAVNICASCDAFILADKHTARNKNTRKLYYARAGQIIYLKQELDGYRLNYIDGINGLYKAITNGMEFTGSKNYYAIVITIFEGSYKGSYDLIMMDFESGVYRINPPNNSFDVIEYIPIDDAMGSITDIINIVNLQGNEVSDGAI